MLPGTIAAIDSDDGPLADIHIDCGGQIILARITRQSMQGLGLHRGMDVFAVIKTVAFSADVVSGGVGERHLADT